MTMESNANSTFEITIDGIALPEETVARINGALQRAVLAELASIDLRGNDLVFRPIMGQMVTERESLGGGGTTGGIQIRVVEPQQS